MDGHHRAMQAMLAGEKTILCEQNQHVPYFERPISAHQSMIADMVPLEMINDRF